MNFRLPLIIPFFWLPPLMPVAQPVGDFTLPPLERRSDEELSQLLQVYVRSIEVRGATVVSPEEIAAVTSLYEGRTVSSAELQELRLALTKLYLEKNYVSSGVLLPDQTVVDGVIYYQAVEGELSRIEVTGDPIISKGYIQSRLRRQIQEPVSIDNIQYALQYLQNDPNISRLDARLAPGDRPGQSVLRVEVDEPTRFEFGASFSNHRATSTGEEEGAVYLRTRNLTTLGEVVTLSTGVSDGADNQSINLAVPISSRNTSLQAYASDSDSAIIESRFRSLDIESLTETRGIRLTHPFVDILNRSLSVTMGYEIRHNESTLAGVPFSLSPGAQEGVSETNVVMLGSDWTERSDNQVFTARLTLRHGGDYEDATIFEPGDVLTSPFNQKINPTGADGRFDLVQVQSLFLRRAGFGGRGQFAIRASGQFSADPLMSIEKISIGGINTVRGYPENFLVRDNGVALSVEYRLPLSGATEEPNVRNLSLVPFLDYGRSWDEVDADAVASGRDTSDANSIAALGLGLVWAPMRGWRAELYWGADIYDDLDSGQDPRDFRDSSLQDEGLHFALTYSLNW